MTEEKVTEVKIKTDLKVYSNFAKMNLDQKKKCYLIVSFTGYNA